jgi:hypothetical protein
MTTLQRALRQARRRFDAQPLRSLLAAVAIVVTTYALVAPFTVVRYPPLTDLPMHAAIASALRHWFDPAWHFQDQFELAPFRSPVLTFYVLTATLALVLPIAWAAKLATALLLSLLPIGLAVYCKGLRKDATMGVAAAGLAWGTVTHWGFISFIAAVGLTMMGLGLALMVLERPTRWRRIGLGAVSVLVFFTHVSQVPPYLLAITLVALITAPTRRQVEPVVIAVAPLTALFGLWWLVRPGDPSASFGLHLDATRVSRMGDSLFHSFRGRGELAVGSAMLAIVALVAAYSVVVPALVAARERRRLITSKRARRASLAALVVAGMFLVLYFVLPLEIGAWSWVYPRELTAAALCALAALPSLPKSPWLRAPALAALMLGITMPTRLVMARYADFDRLTKDFQPVLAALPLAPKLGYIMLDRGDSEGLTRPLLHFPAWVQAERGGWLSFHFAVWRSTPIQFRTSEPMDVAPSTPEGFEMHPEQFDLTTRGKYFDWILVRSRASPAQRVAVDPSLHLVLESGSWWLYERR